MSCCERTTVERCGICDYHHIRYIPSTGDHYTVQECPYVGEPWLYRYVYMEKEQHGAS